MLTMSRCPPPFATATASAIAAAQFKRSFSDAAWSTMDASGVVSFRQCCRPPAASAARSETIAPRRPSEPFTALPASLLLR